jgi:elongation factor G
LLIEEKPSNSHGVLKKAIRRLTCKIELMPVMCGSAFKKKGATVGGRGGRLFALAVGHSPAQGTSRYEKKAETCLRTTTARFCSLAFKLWTDPFVGKLVFFRVYSGMLKKGDTIYNPRTRKRERVSRVMMIQADKRIDVETDLRGRHRRLGRFEEHHHG